MIKRVAVLPFEIPSENPVQRQLVTQLFAQELRNAGVVEVVDIPLDSPASMGLESHQRVAKEFRADAILSGSIDETQGMVVHVRVLDAATDDLLWSGTYLLRSRAEFWSLRTRQQQFQRGFQALVTRFVDESYLVSS